MFWRYKKWIFEKWGYVIAAIVFLFVILAIFRNNTVLNSIVTVIFLFGMIRLNPSRHKKNERDFQYSGIERIDEMKGREFELYLQSLFRILGYKATVTQASGDFGADLVLEKDNIRIVVQAKRYNSSVGISAVQEVHSAISFYKADQAWVVTNAYFTKAAVQLANSTNVKLIGRKELVQILLQARDQPVLRKKA